MARHGLTDDSGRDVPGPVVYLDAYDGFVREVGGQAVTEVVAPAADRMAANHAGLMGRHRRPAHRMALRYRTVPPYTFCVR